MANQHLDFQKVRGLDCHTCNISSCQSSRGFFRTPISALDVELKGLDPQFLEWDYDVGLYRIPRRVDGTCIYYGHSLSKCVLSVEERPNPCLVYPVRVYKPSNDKATQVILHMKCPSSLALFDLYARREPSVVNYIKNAVHIFAWDHDFREFVLKQTKDFDKLLKIGPITDFM